MDSRRILIDHFVLPKDNCQLIATAIIQGTAIAVCDGSYDPRDHLGTAAFVMVASKQDKKPLTAANWSPGTKSDQSAYRSELTGVDSILSALAILVKQYKITSGGITIALDCDTALKTCPPNKPLNIQQPSFDVLQDIRNRIKMLPIIIKWRWVQGHQKEKGLKMDWWARQNFAVNLAAKYFLRKCRRQKGPFRPIRLLHEHWSLYYAKTKQSCIDSKRLYKQIFHKKTRQYWETHHCLLVPSQCKIDREANRLALSLIHI